LIDSFEETLLDKAMRLQNGLIAAATGGSMDNIDYRALRTELANRSEVKNKIPSFVLQCSDVSQFWGWIKYEKDTYAERRDLIWNEFRGLISYLEFDVSSPGTAIISGAIKTLNAQHIQEIWQKALDRRADDPEGAITSAKTLLESTCKAILDEYDIPYNQSTDLPKLWALVAEKLNLAPSQHQEQVFKSILGNCQSIVNYLGTLRNRIGDAHGQGKNPVKPKSRHAELTVNLAGTMAAFLASTMEEIKFRK